MRAKTREKDTYFEAGIAQSLEKWGKLMEKAYKPEFVYLLFRFTSSISAISSANGRYSPPHHSKTCMPSSSSTDSVSVITVL